MLGSRRPDPRASRPDRPSPQQQFCGLVFSFHRCASLFSEETDSDCTYGLLMSQSDLLEVILSFVMKNERLVFETVGRTNKEKFALIRNLKPVAEFNQQQGFGCRISPQEKKES